MRAKTLFILALIVSMTMSMAVPGEAGGAQAGQQPNQPAPWGRATDTFFIELRLDQVRERLLLDVGMAPMHTAVFVEVQKTVHNGDGTQTTSLDFHSVLVDSNGAASVAVPVNHSPDVIDYTIMAHAVHVDGTVTSTERWALLSRPVSGITDIEALFSGLYRDLVEEMIASRIALNDNTAIGQRFIVHGMSQSFVSALPHHPLEFSISGPGTVYTALPLSSMRLSSGPAGVFTAN